MFSWIKAFINNRTIQVRVGGDVSETVFIENGTPQGSFISPILFNTMINDIVREVPQSFGNLLFADDGAIWKRGRNTDHLLSQIQKAIDLTVLWANKWGISGISTSRSKFMIFGYKRNISGLSFSLYDCPLERLNVFKILGIPWMDERLTLKCHIDKLVLKCEKVINILHSLAGSDWGAERDTLFMIYRAMIRSVLDYRCVIFGAVAK